MSFPWKFERSSLHSSRGSALIESALIMPLLVFLALGTCDLGRALVTYMNLNHMVGEVVRSAASVSNLEVDNAVNFSHGCAGVSGPASAQCSGQYQVQNKLRALVSLRKSPVHDLVVSSGLTFDSNESVYMRVRAKYSALLPILPDFTIQVEKRGPYLLLAQ
jgi:Flp pilus assembly protein TadG